jgi:hypothetical protein
MPAPNNARRHASLPPDLTLHGARAGEDRLTPFPAPRQLV